jgi:hypothetical protein
MLNVLPWARPALTELYRKMQGKVHANAEIFLNKEVIQDLTWLSSVIRDSIGVRFVDATTWHDRNAIYSHGEIIGRTPYLEIPIKSSPFHHF